MKPAIKEGDRVRRVDTITFGTVTHAGPAGVLCRVQWDHDLANKAGTACLISLLVVVGSVARLREVL